MILVLAGTTEGRETVAAQEIAGEQVIATTATEYGGELLRKTFKGEIISRPLESSELEKLIRERAIKKVVDATHPYAEQISINARRACLSTKVPYERIERDLVRYAEDEHIIEVGGYNEAVEAAVSYAGTIFLTIGSNKVQLFSESIDPSRLVVRILPLRESLDKCLSHGILPANIIAMQGPFNEEINRILFRRYKAVVVVSKESGSAGGTEEKIKAASALKIPLILINRPNS